MTKNYFFLVYGLFLALLALVLLQGSSGGPALVQGADRTGGPLGPLTCNTAGCHNGGNFNPALDVQVLDNGQPITAYTPGETYTLRVVVNTVNKAARYGFQAVALTGPSNLQAGDFINPPTGVGIRTLNGRKYAEQSFKSISDTFTVSWVAPVANTGDVSIYAAGLASNNNGAISGDASAKITLTLTESGSSSVNTNLDHPQAFKAYTIQNQLRIEAPEGVAQITLMDLNGRNLLSHTYPGGSGVVDLPYLNTGIYLVSWQQGDARMTVKCWMGQ